ncbi:minor capsid protein [Paenibacillus sp. MY03]|uniref:minor capsid protein n=1 Tax=Paenibacillus sp. MY03 TaxID=302980 RepID=UPI00211AA8B7|nr:minor capsid protein [Paenibacillus sp. MY03]
MVINRAAIARLNQIQQQALEMTTEAVRTDIITSAVVPKQTGELERSSYVKMQPGKGRIIFDTPYARRLYWHPEYKFRTDKNPGAQGKWMESYHSGDKRVWVNKTFGAFVKMLGRGLIK